MSERKVFTQRSVDEVANDCSKGHCGCYYSNGNQCCRCFEYQFDRTLIERQIVWDERDYKPKRRDKVVLKDKDTGLRGSTWIFEPMN